MRKAFLNDSLNLFIIISCFLEEDDGLAGSTNQLGKKNKNWRLFGAKGPSSLQGNAACLPSIMGGCGFFCFLQETIQKEFYGHGL